MMIASGSAMKDLIDKRSYRAPKMTKQHLGLSKNHRKIQAAPHMDLSMTMHSSNKKGQ